MATCSATGRAGCQPASASVVRSTTASAPSARCSTTTTVPAGVPAARQGFQRPGQDQERVGRAALAHARGQVVGHHGRIEPQLLDQPGDGPPVHAGDHQAADVTDLQPGRFQGPGQGILAQGQVAVLAEALLPQPRGAVARRPPAIRELVRGRGAGHEFGQHAGALTDQHGRPGIAAGGLVRAGRETVAQVPGDHQVRPASAAAPQSDSPSLSAGRRRSRRRPRRPAGAMQLQLQLRSSCRDRPAPRWRTRAFQGSDQGRSAAPAGPPRPRGSWCPRRGRPRPGCPCRRRSP